MSNTSKYLLLDIGGSWIKGVAIDADAYESARINRDQFLALFENTRRVPSESDDASGHRFLAALKTLAEMCGSISSYKSVAISTAGVVSRCGSRIGKCNNHLAFSPDVSWPKDFQRFLGCPVTFINDGEAFMLGAAELGYVPRMGTVCALIVGTGLGCAVVKDRRWWRPHRRDPLLGSIWVPGGNYDSVVSASKLAEHDVNGDLVRCLSEPEYKAARENYWSDLAQIAVTSALLHGADKVLLGGGLCGAASAAKVDVQKEVSKYFTKLPSELDRWPELKVVAEGNLAQLIGTAALAYGHVKRSISSGLEKAKDSPHKNIWGNSERMDVVRRVGHREDALFLQERAMKDVLSPSKPSKY